MNTHPNTEQISAYLDGMLDVMATRAVATHLGVCESCQAAYDQLRHTRQLMQTLSVPPAPPAEFWANTYRRMRTEEQKPAVAWSWPWTVPVRRLAAGAAALVVVGGYLTMQITGNMPLASPVPVGVAVVNDHDADDVDVGALVKAHAESASVQPLADQDRQAMLSAEVDDKIAGDMLSPEASGNADATL